MLIKSQFPVFGIIVAIVAAVMVCDGLVAQEQAEGGGVAGVASRAVIRLQEQVKKADELAANGAQLQSNGMNKEAMEIYKQAFEITPAIPTTAQRRDAFFNRYQSAAQAYAQTLVDQAEFEKAKGVLEGVYKTAQQSGDIPPSSIGVQTKTLLARLNSDHFNKAMTPKHLENVSAVKTLLLTAQGAADLGDFDKAQTLYNRVLAIDRYNSAARRGLEMVERLIIEYANVSRDSTRAVMLGKIAKGWELPVPPDLSAKETFVYSDALIGSPKALLETKLKNLSIPRVEFQDARLRDVLDFLTQKSQEIDTTEIDPSKRGVNFIINAEAEAADRTLSIQLSNIPLGAALTYIGQKVGLKYRVDDYAVTMVPISSNLDAAMVSRTFRVPPDFISGGNPGGGGAAVSDDPFATPADSGSGATPVSRMNAEEFLKEAGITFDQGASASFNPKNSVLTVRNRPDQLDLIQLLVEDSRKSVSKIVKVDIKLMSVSLEAVQELGVDWLLGQSNFPGSNKLFTSGGTPGNTSNPLSATDFPLPIGSASPVTSGLRGGDTRSTQTIDQIISQGTSGDGSSGSVTPPGIFGLSGFFTDPQFHTVLRGLNQKQGVDRLCEASVVVRPGERATIRQVREFIYPTEYDPPELPNQVAGSSISFTLGGIPVGSIISGSGPVVPATPTAFEMRELGKVIEVDPVVGEDNQTVSLGISTDFSDFSGFIDYGSPISGTSGGSTSAFIAAIFGVPLNQSITITDNNILMPVFDVTRETTNVTVWDGQTIAIGGLITEAVEDVEDKVPGLGDLPVVGRAFRNKNERGIKKGIVMFVSVKILDPAGNPINESASVPESLPPQR